MWLTSPKRSATISVLFYTAKTRVLMTLAYRFEVFSSVVTSFVLMISTVFFWKAAYQGIPAVEAVGLQQMITYSIISALLGTLFSFNTENTVNERIREGAIAMDFIKPVNPFLLYFAEDIGSSLSALVQKFLPLLVFALVFVQVPAPASGLHFLLFLLSAAASFFILWTLSALVGLAAFWVIDLGPLGFVKDVIVRILSGSIIPVWFFPGALQSVLTCLPFIYTYQLPIGIYIGKYSLAEAVVSMAIQMAWLAGLFLLFIVLERRARNHLLVQGG